MSLPAKGERANSTPVSGQSGKTRFRKSFPCPICGGTDDDQRGEGKRCFGFLSADGKWAHCTREEFAGRAVLKSGSNAYPHVLKGKCPCGEEHAPADPKPRKARGSAGRIVEKGGKKPGSFASHLAAGKWLTKKVLEGGRLAGDWIYRDLDGTVYAAVLRFGLPDAGKTYRPTHRDAQNGLWGIGDPPNKWLPYRADKIRDAPIVWFFEGEKCVEIAVGLGLNATSAAHGAKSPNMTDYSVLAGKTVVVVPDNDPDGDAYVESVVGLLSKLDPPAVVKVVRLPGLAEKGDDLAEWVETRNGRSPDELRRELEALRLEVLDDVSPPKTLQSVERNGKHETNGKPHEAEFTYSDLSDEDLGIAPLSSFECRPIRWFWKYRFAKASLAMTVGDGGVGKSQILLYIAHLASIAGDFPDGSGAAPGCNVILVSAEDRPEDTIRPRLEAMGADISRIVIVKAKYVIRKEGKPPVVNPASFQERGYWHEVFDRNPACSLFIVDPLPSYLGRGVNDSKNIEIRQVLEPFLDEVIAPRDICMIGNTHLNKTLGAKTPMQRISGSIAYGNLPRNVHFVVRDPDRPERRFMKQAKCNNAPDDLPALAFTVERREVKDADGEIIETAIPVFEAETVAVNLGDVVNGTSPSRGPDPKKETEAAEWIHDYLVGRTGWTLLRDIRNAAGAAGLIGKYDEEKGHWSNLMRLYRGKDRVSDLPAPRDRKRIEEQDMAETRDRYPKVCWRLLDAEQAF